VNAWRVPAGLRTRDSQQRQLGSRLMLNTFHVRRVERTAAQEGRLWLQAVRAAGPAGTATIRGLKLAYANFVIDLSTPARNFNFRPVMLDAQAGSPRRSLHLVVDSPSRRSAIGSLAPPLASRLSPITVDSPTWHSVSRNSAGLHTTHSAQ